MNSLQSASFHRASGTSVHRGLKQSAPSPRYVQFGSIALPPQGNGPAQRVQTVKTVLAQMPTRDKQALTALFRKMFADDYAGYTLLGIKPMFKGGTSVDEDWEDQSQLPSPLNSAEERNLMVWERYRSLLPLPNFVLRRDINKFMNAPNSQIFVLINKRATLAKIREHLEEFQKVVGQPLSPEGILSCLETVNPVSQALNSRESTEAALLGYGLAGGKLYERDIELAFKSGEGWKFPVRKDISPSDGYETTEDEQSAIQRIFDEGEKYRAEQVGDIPDEEFYSPPPPWGTHPPLPGFATVCGDTEGIGMLRQAIEARPKLVELCKLDDARFLEEVLCEMARQEAPGGFTLTA